MDDNNLPTKGPEGQPNALICCIDKEWSRFRRLARHSEWEKDFVVVDGDGLCPVVRLNQSLTEDKDVSASQKLGCVAYMLMVVFDETLGRIHSLTPGYPLGARTNIVECCRKPGGPLETARLLNWKAQPSTGQCCSRINLDAPINDGSQDGSCIVYIEEEQNVIVQELWATQCAAKAKVENLLEDFADLDIKLPAPRIVCCQSDEGPTKFIKILRPHEEEYFDETSSRAPQCLAMGLDEPIGSTYERELFHYPKEGYLTVYKVSPSECIFDMAQQGLLTKDLMDGK